MICGSSASVLHHEVVLGAGARDAEGVGFLEGVAADQLARDLAGDGDDRDRIHHGVDQAGDQVGGAGTGGGAADADLAGGPRIALGGEGGVLFVPHQDVPDRVIVEGVVERQRDAAGISEDALDVFPQQTFEQHLSRQIKVSTYENSITKSLPLNRKLREGLRSRKGKRATGWHGNPPVAPILIREAPLGGSDYDHRYERDYYVKVHITKDGRNPKPGRVSGRCCLRTG